MPGRRVVAAIVALAIVVFVIGRLTATRGPEGDAAGDPPDREARPPASGEERAPGLAVPARGIGSPDGTAVEDGAVDPDDVGPAVRVRGRVVDGARRPVGDAAVRVEVSGVGPVVVRTGGDGRFDAAVKEGGPAPLRIAVAAESGGRVAARTVPTPIRGERRFDVGDLVLAAGVRVAVRVVDAGRPVGGASVHLAVANPRDVRRFDAGTMSGRPRFVGWVAHATTDAEGLAVFPSVPAGDVAVLARADGPRRGRVEAAADGDVALEVPLARARDVRVTVIDAATRAPLAGVRLGVETSATGEFSEDPWDDPWPVAPTGPDGTTTLPAMPGGTSAALTVLGDGWNWPPWRSPVPLPPDVDTLEIEVPAAVLEVRREAVFEDGPPPPDRTPVTFEASWGGSVRGFWGDHGAPVASGRVDGGALVIGGLRHRHDAMFGRARLPDGRTGRLDASPVVFRGGRTVRVTVHEEDGAAAAGVPVVVESSGRRVAWTRTGADGVATISDVGAGARAVVESGGALVETWRHGVFEEELVASLDGTPSPSEVAFVLPGFVEARLTVTVGGRPGFPPGLDVVAGLSRVTADRADLPDATWDPASGTVRFRVRRPTGTRRLYVTGAAPGHAIAEATFRPADAPGVLEARLEMRPAGGLDLDVLGLGIRSPEWLPELQGDDGAFHRDVVRIRPDADAGAIPRADDVAAGTWRLRDDWSGCVSESVRVEAGGRARLRLDLRHLRDVQVAVELPPGVEATDLVVRREAEGLVLVGQDREIRGRTSFRLTLPGDRPVRLWAEHPACVTTPGEGDVTVTAPGPRVALRLRAR
ncbi:MAG: hypothetical protein JNM10_06865 [Planctomycetia bacterium]|nr:hypothetical protein [Planctomycetia bacterium]